MIGVRRWLRRFMRPCAIKKVCHEMSMVFCNFFSSCWSGNCLSAGEALGNHYVDKGRKNRS